MGNLTNLPIITLDDRSTGQLCRAAVHPFSPMMTLASSAVPFPLVTTAIYFAQYMRQGVVQRALVRLSQPWVAVLRQSDSNPLPTFWKIISSSQRGCTTKIIQQRANPTYSEPCHFFKKKNLLGGSCTIKGVLSCMKEFSYFFYLKQAALISHPIAAFSFSFPEAP